VVEDIPQLGIVRDLVRSAHMNDRGKEETFHKGAEDNIGTKAFRSLLYETLKLR
jgi:hypothetical protein